MAARKERAAAANANSIVQEAVNAAIRAGGEIGLQVAAYVDGERVVDVWGGLADETTGRTVNGDTLFPVFSVTKAVTATALHIQAERGLVDYDTPIAHYWPEFGAHGKEKGTVRDALTHRIGIPQMPEGVTPELMCDWEWMYGSWRTRSPSLRQAPRVHTWRIRLGGLLARSCGARMRKGGPSARSSRRRSARRWALRASGLESRTRWSPVWPSSPTSLGPLPEPRGCPPNRSCQLPFPRR